MGFVSLSTEWIWLFAIRAIAFDITSKPPGQVAQLAAAAELLCLRRPLTSAETEAEPDMEPEAGDEKPVAKPVKEQVLSSSEVAKVLLQRLPAFRLGLAAETLSEVLRLSEASRGEGTRSRGNIPDE
ncbi:Uncharacterized protein SCF082_LOCUS51995 [Durusdinium trenchii]|uniref:Uncharacterized protein n=1 Tax=Durusdinium trenchii TaxID=1381693 RepID=A0ABP0SIA5_9DINO